MTKETIVSFSILPVQSHTALSCKALSFPTGHKELLLILIRGWWNSAAACRAKHGG